MANEYRVDVASCKATPCGMNSIKYIGSSFSKAEKAFRDAETGKDAWNQPNAAYGVILSVWNGSEYVVKMSKGLS